MDCQGRNQQLRKQYTENVLENINREEDSTAIPELNLCSTSGREGWGAGVEKFFRSLFGEAYLIPYGWVPLGFKSRSVESM